METEIVTTEPDDHKARHLRFIDAMPARLKAACTDVYRTDLSLAELERCLTQGASGMYRRDITILTNILKVHVATLEALQVLNGTD